MSVLAGVYNGSFSGAGFFILVPLNETPIAQMETQYHHPTTDSNTTIDMGKGIRNWEQKVAVDEADLDNLRGQVGVTGTYSYHRGNITAKLKSMSTPIKTPGWPVYEVTLQLSCGN